VKIRAQIRVYSRKCEHSWNSYPNSCKFAKQKFV